MNTSEIPDFAPESATDPIPVADAGATTPLGNADLASRRHQMFPRLSASDIERLKNFG